MLKREAAPTDKLGELESLILVQDSVISHAKHMRDNDSMFERSKEHLEGMIAKHQKKLDYLLEARENANDIIDAAFIRRDQLRSLVRHEKHRIKIEKFLKLQAELKELESVNDVEGGDLELL